MYQTIPIAIVSPEVLLKEITMSLVFTAVAHVLTVLLTSISFTPIFNLNVNSLDQCQFPEGYSSNNYYIVYAVHFSVTVTSWYQEDYIHQNTHIET